MAGSPAGGDMAGTPWESPPAWVPGRMFNPRTRHRGHAHALISRIGANPPELDLIYFTRDPDFV